MEDYNEAWERDELDEEEEDEEEEEEVDWRVQRNRDDDEWDKIS